MNAKEVIYVFCVLLRGNHNLEFVGSWHPQIYQILHCKFWHKSWDVDNSAMETNYFLLVEQIKSA